MLGLISSFTDATSSDSNPGVKKVADPGKGFHPILSRNSGSDSASCGVSIAARPIADVRGWMPDLGCRKLEISLDVPGQIHPGTILLGLIPSFTDGRASDYASRRLEMYLAPTPSSPDVPNPGVQEVGGLGKRGIPSSPALPDQIHPRGCQYTGDISWVSSHLTQRLPLQNLYVRRRTAREAFLVKGESSAGTWGTECWRSGEGSQSTHLIQMCRVRSCIPEGINIKSCSSNFRRAAGSGVQKVGDPGKGGHPISPTRQHLNNPILAASP